MKSPMLCETGSLNDLKRQGYVAETKWDGTRVVIVKEGNIIALWNRDGINYTARLPEIVQAAKRIPESFTMDGEAVYVNPKTGEAEFTPCQSSAGWKMTSPPSMALSHSLR